MTKPLLFHTGEFNNLNNSQIADLLNNLKKSYGLTSKFIAASMQTSDTNLSLWLNHKKQMNKQGRDSALCLLWNYWQPALLVFHFLDKDIYWSCGDIKNPFITHIVPKHLSPEEVEEENAYIQKIKDKYEKEQPQFEIVRHYTQPEILTFGVNDEGYCNTQVAFHQTPVLIWSNIIMGLDPKINLIARQGGRNNDTNSPT